MSVDVEIYMNNIIKFFRDNPNDLLNLVPKNKEQDFYQKIREIAINNYDKGEEVNLTQRQIIDICVELNQPKKKPVEESVENLFVKTKFGEYCLN
jgi:sugar-specific transcriptional regulator TrmB